MAAINTNLSTSINELSLKLFKNLSSGRSITI